jgi:hypothetical protein
MSSITLVNEVKSGEVIRIAIYKKPVVDPVIGAIAWKVITLSSFGDQAEIDLSNAFELYANVPDQGDALPNPASGTKTEQFSLTENTAYFVAQPAELDPQSIVLNQRFKKLSKNKVCLENLASRGVWMHIVKDGEDIYCPQFVWPGAAVAVDLRSPFYLAVVTDFMCNGSRLIEEETSMTEIPIKEGQVVTVTGSWRTGYTIHLS